MAHLTILTAEEIKRQSKMEGTIVDSIKHIDGIIPHYIITLQTYDGLYLRYDHVGAVGLTELKRFFESSN